MTREHKLREKRVKGSVFLQCKRCKMTCSLDMRDVVMTTKCLGRSR